MEIPLFDPSSAGEGQDIVGDDTGAGRVVGCCLCVNFGGEEVGLLAWVNGGALVCHHCH